MSTHDRRVALIGAKGLLGSGFAHHLGIPEEFCIGRANVNILQPNALQLRLDEIRPDVVINCAADTDVEGAERDVDKAYSANAMLPGLIARLCKDRNVCLVHFSSTGCYGSYKTEPYNEFDDLRPTTIHHRSKAAGEVAIRETGAKALIVRLGWLYGSGLGQKKNFVWARMVEARGKDEIVSDPYQWGVPTRVDDVVKQILVMIEADLVGTFNVVASGHTSRFDYVRAIISAAQLPTRLLPRRFARLAPVSPNETAINYKLDLLGLNRMPKWDEALSSFVTELLSTHR